MKLPLLLCFALVAAVARVSAQDNLQVVFPKKDVLQTPPVFTQAEIDSMAPQVDGPVKTSKGDPKSGKNTVAISPSIIGGTGAIAGQFPWMVAVIQDNAWFCGGTLITTQYVLTAAHCAYRISNFTLYFGSTDYRDTATRITVISFSKIIHRRYSSSSLANDIAVIKLPSAIALISGKVGTIRLPKLSQGTTTFVGTQAVASGWGKTSDGGSVSGTLNYVNLTVISNNQCGNVYGYVAGSVICTAGNPTFNICNGDSGGPLQYEESDRFYTQIGIVSFGASASCYNYPAGFTRVTSYLSWLQTNTGVAIRA